MSGDAELADKIERLIAVVTSKPDADMEWLAACSQLAICVQAHGRSILAALRRLEPAADAVEAVAKVLRGPFVGDDGPWSLDQFTAENLARGVLEALAALPRPEADEGALVSRLTALAGRWEAQALNREQYEPSPCFELRGCAQDLRAALAAAGRAGRGTLTDTEMLSLIEHYGWHVEPLTDGGWCISSPVGRGRNVRLAHTRSSLREALRQAMRAQAERATRPAADGDAARPEEP